MSLSTGTIYMKKKKKQNKKYMELNQKKVGLTKGSSKTKKNHQNAEVKHKVEIIKDSTMVF